jgi:hypothetical protein
MATSKDYFDFLNKLENDAQFCYNYLEKTSFNKNHPTYQQCIQTISKDAEIAVTTAEKIIKGRFELAEPTISKFPEHSYFYARDILKGRFELGEPAIAKDSRFSFEYALRIVRGRFELGENAIAQDEDLSYRYATEIIMGKLPEEMHNAMMAKAISK